MPAGRPKSADPTRDQRLAVRVTADLRKKVTEAAKRDRRSVSDWIALQLERAVSGGAPNAPDAPESKPPPKPGRLQQMTDAAKKR